MCWGSCHWMCELGRLPEKSSNKPVIYYINYLLLISSQCLGTISIYSALLLQFICMAFLFKYMASCSSGSIHTLRLVCSCLTPLSWVISRAVLFTSHHNHVRALLIIPNIQKVGSLAQVFPHQICFSLKCYEISSICVLIWSPHQLRLIPWAGILPLVRAGAWSPLVASHLGPAQHRCPPVGARLVGQW